MKLMIKICKIHALSDTLSPLTHMMGTSGNESIINREKILHNGMIRDVPVISGNAIRHRMIREFGSLHLIKSCRLEGKLNLDQANYLFNGGSLTKSSPAENLSKIAEMQSLIPLIRLLGGALTNQVISGSLIVHRGVLVCEENRKYISRMLPKSIPIPSEMFLSCEDFISKTQYTRGDAKKRGDIAKIADIEDEKEESNLMIYTGQSIIPGALFYHGFILQNVSEIEIGALLSAIYQWDYAGGTIGGSSRIGHGRLKTSLFFENKNDIFGGDFDPQNLIDMYNNHIIENSEKIINWLNIVFPSAQAVKIKKKEGKVLLSGEIINDNDWFNSK